MRLTIRHETLYRYTAPLGHTIQQLRLTPRDEPHQRILNWQLQTPGERHEFIDAFGNLSHMVTVAGAHEQVRLVASGKVDIAPLERGRLHTPETLSPLVFTIPTRLSDPDEGIREFAHRHLHPSAQSSDLLGLAHAIRDAVSYQRGATIVTTTAAEVLRLQSGVCQDHAHLFLACCRVHGIPARYVSGYIDAGDADHAESHAWIDAWVDEGDFSGWVSIDVTHARFAGDVHCRLAVGRDYESAAPTRGVRQGGGEESLSVRVDVTLQQ